MSPEGVGATGVEPLLTEHAPPRLPSGELNAETIGQSVGALLPENAILMNEINQVFAQRGIVKVEPNPELETNQDVHPSSISNRS